MPKLDGVACGAEAGSERVTPDSPQHVVFIDSRVPDLQDLLDGLKPGEQAFVIDQASAGLEQIAAILAANHFTDLSAISIVSHGTTGELALGSSLITDGTLGAHAGAPAAIGGALGTGGALHLSGGDVAKGQAGQQFIDDFSTHTGGVQVDAATHIVGSASLGGSWILDAMSGAPAPQSTSAARAAMTPFTAAALDNFQGQLVTPLTGQLFF